MSATADGHPQLSVPPKIVSERLGHHSVAFTLDTYAHVMPGMQAEAAESLADAVFGLTDDDDESDTQEPDEHGNGGGPDSAV